MSKDQDAESRLAAAEALLARANCLLLSAHPIVSRSSDQRLRGAINHHLKQRECGFDDTAGPGPSPTLAAAEALLERWHDARADQVTQCEAATEAYFRRDVAPAQAAEPARTVEDVLDNPPEPVPALRAAAERHGLRAQAAEPSRFSGQPPFDQYPAQAAEPAPVALPLQCPACKLQHIDTVDPVTGIDWATRPHKTHLCLGCGVLFKPYEYPTAGVEHPDTIALRECRVELSNARTSAFNWQSGAESLKDAVESARADLATARARITGLERELLDTARSSFPVLHQTIDALTTEVRALRAAIDAAVVELEGMPVGDPHRDRALAALKVETS